MVIVIHFLRDENFLGIPRNPGFFVRFSGFSRVGVPIWGKNKFFLVKMIPQFILSSLKCKSVTPKALKLHLQSIKLQKSFYSSNFCSFMCAVMLWYAKFQFFFVSTILILDFLYGCHTLFCCGFCSSLIEHYAYHCCWAPLRSGDSDFGQDWKPGTRGIPYFSNDPKGSFRCINRRQSTHHFVSYPDILTNFIELLPVQSLVIIHKFMDISFERAFRKFICTFVYTGGIVVRLLSWYMGWWSKQCISYQVC
jgi:hypothetical protein